MSELPSELLESTRLLFDLQQGNKIAQTLSGCLEPEEIARRVTEGLVEKFDCAFARIWLVEPDRTALRLVASSGMYTRLDGSFARVPMGAFKVGKIAQNCIPFLSNHLADESWVRDRAWAIEHQILGFAGYPLVATGEAVGVLAVFSQQAMAPEFLEVLQGLCTTVTIAIENALQYQQEKQAWQTITNPTAICAPLSEQLASMLGNTRLILVGTERSLTVPLICLLLRTAEVLNRINCVYCRLTYSAQTVSLEAVVSCPEAQPQIEEMSSAFGDSLYAASALGGTVQIQTSGNQKMLQVLLTIPYPGCLLGPRLRINCHLPVLQMAFTHLAHLAGLTVSTRIDSTVPLLTDDLAQAQTVDSVLWVTTQPRTLPKTLPKNVKAKLDLSTQPGQLREAVEMVMQGRNWQMESEFAAEPQNLSEREQEIMSLLALGFRDRDIANQLHISERTVKFHINNILTKLKARTRFQALYQATLNGWISVEEAK